MNNPPLGQHKASMYGLGFWVVAILAVIAAYYAPSFPGAEQLKGIGVLSSVFSGISFLIAAIRNPTRHALNCGGCILALYTLLIPATSVQIIHGRHQTQIAIQETTRTIITLHKLANDIETFRGRIGRLPNDQVELMQLLGKPIPHYGPGRYPISYHRSNGGDYRLECIIPSFWGYRWDLFGYIVGYYGPKGKPRMQVVLF